MGRCAVFCTPPCTAFCHRNITLNASHQAAPDPSGRSAPSQAPGLMDRSWRWLQRAGGLVYALGYGFGIGLANGAVRAPGQAKNVVLVKRFCRQLCAQLGVQVTVHGSMPQVQALWVSNHVSWVDVPVIGSQAPVFFLAKAEVGRWPVVGALARIGGTLFIRRGSGDSDSVLQQVAGFLREKKSVIFFPEATTTDGRRIKKIHAKLLGAALQTGTPIQPLVLCYVTAAGTLDERVPFINDTSMAQHLTTMLGHDPVHAHVQALERIDPTGHDLDSLRDLVQARMDQGLEALHRQVLRPAALADLYPSAAT